MNTTLVDYSNLLLWSAVGIYALSFVSFTIDLARRASWDRIDEYRAGLSLRLGVSFALLGLLVHVAAIVTRGIAAGRVPWDNLFGYAMISTAIVVLAFLLVQLRADLRFVGTFVMGFVIILLGGAITLFYVDVVPLAVSLQSLWLVFHVFVAALGLGFFGVGFALSVVQLLRQSEESRTRRAVDGAALGRGARFLRTFPSSDALETFAYRVNIVGFVFWSFTLVAGAIWAEAAWGRYWGWDTKEVWTFIIWVIYAGYIHARATRGWRGSPSAWLSIVGFLAVIFNATIVNVYFNGLHSYSGLPGVE